MAYTTTNISLMCRCSRTTKLYQNINDIQPTISAILSAGTIFVSDKTAVVGNTVLRQITSSPTNENLPFGYWCPASVLEEYTIETEDEPVEEVTYDDSISVDETLRVKSSKVTVYVDKQTSAIVTHTLKQNDTLTVDRKVSCNCNGVVQSRYHITDTSSEDKSVIDKWVLNNGYVSVMSKVVTPKLAAARSLTSPFPSLIPSLPNDTSDDSKDTTYTSPIVIQNTNQTAVNSLFTNSIIKSPDALMEQGINNIQMLQEAAENYAESQYATDAFEAYASEYSRIDNSLGNVPIGRMTFVHGMPFQYNYITDRRIGATAKYAYDGASVNAAKNGDVDMYGRIFAKEIAGNMPIMVLIPGEPVYLTKAEGLFKYRGSASKSLKDLFAPFWADLSGSDYDSALEDLLANTDGVYDYFSFQINMTEYYNYANPLCRQSAALMKLGDRQIMGKSCTTFNWADYNKDVSQDYNVFAEVIGYGDGISFAYDPLSAISDSLGNDTSESQFASMLQGLTSKARELQFIAGQSGSSALNGLFSASDFEGSVSDINTGLASRLGTFLENVSKGFNIRFPDIWTGSSHTRSYSVDMHFITPYATNYCKWRYVLCPFFMLFALAAPQAPLSMSVYGRPFTIRAFSLGYFNVENGIIESIEWRRFGDGDMISQNGIPTQMDVSIGFKDLYHVLTQGKTNTPKYMGAFFSNIGLMDMIGALSGVNVNMISLGDRISIYFNTAVQSIMDIPTNFMSNVQDRFHRVADRFIYNQ